MAASAPSTVQAPPAPAPRGRAFRLATLGLVAAGLLALIASRLLPTAGEGFAHGASRSARVEFRSGPYVLHGDVMKPAGEGPFPAIVYNHGSEKNPGLDFGDLGDFFRSKGYVVFFPYRRGTVGSTGQHWADEVKRRPPAEAPRATVEQLEAQNDDVLAAIAWIAARPYVDATRVAVAGCSFGGIEALLTAEKSLGIYAAVDFAGASMSWSGSPLLQERMKSAARAARVPVFFAQAENDFNTTPSILLSREMSAAGKPNGARIFPRHGETAMDGHAGFCTEGMSAWGDDVLAFLRSHEK